MLLTLNHKLNNNKLFKDTGSVAEAKVEKPILVILKIFQRS